VRRVWGSSAMRRALVLVIGCSLIMGITGGFCGYVARYSASGSRISNHEAESLESVAAASNLRQVMSRSQRAAPGRAIETSSPDVDKFGTRNYLMAVRAEMQDGETTAECIEIAAAGLPVAFG